MASQRSHVCICHLTLNTRFPLLLDISSEVERDEHLAKTLPASLSQVSRLQSQRTEPRSFAATSRPRTATATPHSQNASSLSTSEMPQSTATSRGISVRPSEQALGRLGSTLPRSATTRPSSSRKSNSTLRAEEIERDKSRRLLAESLKSLSTRPHPGADTTNPDSTNPSPSLAPQALPGHNTQTRGVALSLSSLSRQSPLPLTSSSTPYASPSISANPSFTTLLPSNAVALSTSTSSNDPLMTTVPPTQSIPLSRAARFQQRVLQLQLERGLIQPTLSLPDAITTNTGLLPPSSSSSSSPSPLQSPSPSSTLTSTHRSVSLNAAFPPSSIASPAPTTSSSSYSPSEELAQALAILNRYGLTATPATIIDPPIPTQTLMNKPLSQSQSLSPSPSSHLEEPQARPPLTRPPSTHTVLRRPTLSATTRINPSAPTNPSSSPLASSPNSSASSLASSKPKQSSYQDGLLDTGEVDISSSHSYKPSTSPAVSQVVSLPLATQASLSHTTASSKPLARRPSVAQSTHTSPPSFPTSSSTPLATSLRRSSTSKPVVPSPTPSAPSPSYSRSSSSLKSSPSAIIQPPQSSSSLGSPYEDDESSSGNITITSPSLLNPSTTPLSTPITLLPLFDLSSLPTPPLPPPSSPTPSSVSSTRRSSIVKKPTTTNNNNTNTTGINSTSRGVSKPTIAPSDVAKNFSKDQLDKSNSNPSDTPVQLVGIYEDPDSATGDINIKGDHSNATLPSTSPVLAEAITLPLATTNQMHTYNNSKNTKNNNGSSITPSQMKAVANKDKDVIPNSKQLTSPKATTQQSKVSPPSPPNINSRSSSSSATSAHVKTQRPSITQRVVKPADPSVSTSSSLSSPSLSLPAASSFPVDTIDLPNASGDVVIASGGQPPTVNPLTGSVVVLPLVQDDYNNKIKHNSGEDSRDSNQNDNGLDVLSRAAQVKPSATANKPVSTPLPNTTNKTVSSTNHRTDKSVPTSSLHSFDDNHPNSSGDIILTNLSPPTTTPQTNNPPALPLFNGTTSTSTAFTKATPSPLPTNNHSKGASPASAPGPSKATSNLKGGPTTKKDASEPSSPTSVPSSPSVSSASTHLHSPDDEIGTGDVNTSKLLTPSTTPLSNHVIALPLASFNTHQTSVNTRANTTSSVSSPSNATVKASSAEKAITSTHRGVSLQLPTGVTMPAKPTPSPTPAILSSLLEPTSHDVDNSDSRGDIVISSPNLVNPSSTPLSNKAIVLPVAQIPTNPSPIDTPSQTQPMSSTSTSKCLPSPGTLPTPLKSTPRPITKPNTTQSILPVPSYEQTSQSTPNPSNSPKSLLSSTLSPYPQSVSSIDNSSSCLGDVNLSTLHKPTTQPLSQPVPTLPVAALPLPPNIEPSHHNQPTAPISMSLSSTSTPKLSPPSSPSSRPSLSRTPSTNTQLQHHSHHRDSPPKQPSPVVLSATVSSYPPPSSTSPPPPPPQPSSAYVPSISPSIIQSLQQRQMEAQASARATLSSTSTQLDALLQRDKSVDVNAAIEGIDAVLQSLKAGLPSLSPLSSSLSSSAKGTNNRKASLTSSISNNGTSSMPLKGSEPSQLSKTTGAGKRQRGSGGAGAIGYPGTKDVVPAEIMPATLHMANKLNPHPSASRRSSLSTSTLSLTNKSDEGPLAWDDDVEYAVAEGMALLGGVPAPSRYAIDEMERRRSSALATMEVSSAVRDQLKKREDALRKAAGR